MTEKADNFDDIENEVFGDGEAVADTPVIDEPVTPPVEQDATQEVVAEPKTDEPAPVDAEAPLEPVLEVEATPTPEGMMPYGAYASEKTKRQEAMERAEKVEAEAKALREEVAAFKVRQQVEAQMNVKPIPDPIDDPEAQGQWIQDRLAEQAHHQQIQMSEFMARQSLGNEKVDAATAAVMAVAETQPWVTERIKAATSPHAEAVKWHEEQQLLTQAQQQAANPQPQLTQGAPVASQSPTAAQPVIPPNMASQVSAAPANAKQTWEDVEQGLWG